MRALAQRWLPFATPTVSLEDIYNYRDLDGLFGTSGQPELEQFDLIRDAGFETVINLAPTSVLENSVKDESTVVEQLGLEYVHIPVDFKDPTEVDYAAFVEAVETRIDRRIWVHCAANMRVSAFIYRYRRTGLGHDEADARRDLEALWEPFGVWKDFIAR